MAGRSAGGDAGEGSAPLASDRPPTIVSNREPYSHEREDGTVVVREPAGGLTTALDPVVQRLGGTWVAWGSGDADSEVVGDDDRVRVPPDDPAYDLRRVWLDDEDVEGYYYGYSNRGLWPLCHGMTARASFDAEEWARYRAVNERFAEAAVAEAGEDGPVWFHDYHFALAPRMVRRRRPDAPLAQFWHVPWPSWDALQTCPQHRHLLDGLLAADLVGFHTERYCENFLDCAAAGLGADVDREAREVHYDGGRTRVGAFPLGADGESLADLARSPAAEEFWDSFAAEHGLSGVDLLVGVDRLDYTKGVVRRLDAIERLFERRPDLRGAVTYVQKGTETRTGIEAYREYQQRVGERVAAVNDRFGTDDWQPVVAVREMLPREGLAALYRHADAALVSPVRDGMNLVAKEFVAAQVDESGVLVLSELAGASDELGDGALVVHPDDADGFAAAIEGALSMPPAARRRRMRTLRERVVDGGGDGWAAEQLSLLADLSTDGGGERPTRGRPGTDAARAARPVPAWSRLDDVGERLRGADGLLVLTDFDGTLADVVARPGAATIRPNARRAVARLADQPRAAVAVVSGRGLADVRARVGVEGVHYAGNHGLELLADGHRVGQPDAAAASETIAALSERLTERLDDVDGVVVEDKGLTASVHYRMVDADAVPRVRRAVRAAVDGAEGVRLTEGKQVLELRPAVDWDKGDAVSWLRDELVPDDERWLAVYLGDDATDEAAFATLPEDGLAVRVGSDDGPTAATAAVAGVEEAADLLSWLGRECEAVVGPRSASVPGSR